MYISSDVLTQLSIQILRGLVFIVSTSEVEITIGTKASMRNNNYSTMINDNIDNNDNNDTLMIKTTSIITTSTITLKHKDCCG